jgi:hypothetical protein
MEVSGQLHTLVALPTVTHWIGGWVVPGPIWALWRREKTPCNFRELNPVTKATELSISLLYNESFRRLQGPKGAIFRKGTLCTAVRFTNLSGGHNVSMVRV